MSENKSTRLNQAARELNIGIANIVEYLGKKGFSIDSNPNTRLDSDQYELLQKEFAQSAQTKKDASSISIGKKFPDTVPEKPKKLEDNTVQNFAPPATHAAPKIAASVPASDAGNIIVAAPTTPVVILPSAELTSLPVANSGQNLEVNNINNSSSEPAKKSGLTVLGKIDLTEFSGKKSASQQQQSPSSNAGSGSKNTSKNSANPDKPPGKETDSQNNRRSQSQGTGNNQSPGARSRPPAASKSVAQTGSSAAPTPPPPTAPPPTSPAPPPVPIPEPVVIQVIAEPETINLRVETLKGLTVLGKIELPADKAKKGKPSLNPAVLSEEEKRKRKRKRKRVNSGPGIGSNTNTNTNSSATGTTASSVGSSENNNRNYSSRPNQTGRPSDNNNNNNNNNSGNTNNNNSGSNNYSRPRPTGTTGSGSGAASNNTGNAFNKNRTANKPTGKPADRAEVSDKEIQDQIKATLSRLSAGTRTSGMANRAKHRRDRRTDAAAANEERMFQEQQEAKSLRVTEFVSANDLASLMDVSVNEVIATCMSLGMFVSINQRLDAEAITVIADEFGFNVDFSSVEEEQLEELIIDSEDSLVARAPIVTIMGHVDHGKTSLLDYIRKTKVASGEAGGITQHIGAYNVTTDSGRQITFLDTPGHEAFTAMRARGAKVTDVVIIVVAADDNVMPQTEEAINHAKAANVPIVIAINKIDKAGANPEKVREELANRNVLVEDWGGKYQCEEISAKTGHGISNLLEKVLLEAELLDLKANPARQAGGTVIEVMLDKGRGYVSTVVVQNGTLKVGDVVLAGSHYGKVKAMNDYRGQKVKTAGPSIAVQILGLDGAPQAGDRFSVFELEREAREIANKREQLQREQTIRTKKHITIDEIGRRIALGTFKELNLIVKGDVDGSVEALSGSLLKLSSPEVEVRIIHKAVGQISESDIQLATASDAIVVGFQVRPSLGARKLAEQEEIQIKLYSIIYDAINEIKAAIEGMIAPKIEEIITATVEIRQVFKISKVGNIAGCMVTDGTLYRKHKVRVIRDGIVLHTGNLETLKRFKDDVSEVRQGFDCGLNIDKFNDIKEGDIVEAFEMREIKKLTA